MPYATLATIAPYDPVTGQVVMVRVCSGNYRQITGLGGNQWEPALVTPPVMTMTLWNGDFKAAVDAGSATLAINMKRLHEGLPNASRYVWQGAVVEIYADLIGLGWPWTSRMKGVVTDYSRKLQVLTLTLQVNHALFDKNVLTATYAGTGLIEGAADLHNKLKPLVIGWAQNVEPALIDATNSVYQFSGYGPIEGVTKLYERASDFGAAMADYANYAALVAATITRGRWATCLAQGLVRLGAPAYGVITGDVKGHAVSGTTPRLTGAVIKLLASISGVAATDLYTASLDVIDVAAPYPVNLNLTNQITFTDQATAMALSCNCQAGISLGAQFFVAPVSLARDAAIAIDAQGKASPQVTVSEELATSVPYWRTIMGANQSWRVHSTDEVAFEAPLVERGPWDATFTYADGNTVTQPDGSRWLYINGTRTLGNALPTWPTASNTYWSNLVPPVLASGITYADRTPIESLKPAEAAADVTSAIVGVANIDVAADYTGAITDTMPRLVQFKFMRQADDLTTSATWSVSVVSGTIAASIGAATGLLSLNTSSGTMTNSVLQLTAVYGTTTRTLRVTVTVNRAPSPSSGSGGGTSASSGFSGTINSNTMTAIGPALTITVGSVGAAALHADYTFTMASSSGGLSAQWYWWNGTAYVALGSAVASTDNAIASDGSPGSGSINYSDTGRTALSSQKYQLYARTSLGTTARAVSGNISAIGS